MVMQRRPAAEIAWSVRRQTMAVALHALFCTYEKRSIYEKGTRQVGDVTCFFNVGPEDVGPGSSWVQLNRCGPTSVVTPTNSLVATQSVGVVVKVKERSPLGIRRSVSSFLLFLFPPLVSTLWAKRPHS